MFFSEYVLTISDYILDFKIFRAFQISDEKLFKLFFFQKYLLKQSGVFITYWVGW